MQICRICRTIDEELKVILVFLEHLLLIPSCTEFANLGLSVSRAVCIKKFKCKHSTNAFALLFNGELYLDKMLKSCDKRNDNIIWQFWHSFLWLANNLVDILVHNTFSTTNNVMDLANKQDLGPIRPLQHKCLFTHTYSIKKRIYTTCTAQFINLNHVDCVLSSLTWQSQSLSID